MTCYRSVVFMIKFVSDLLQVGGFHDKLASDLLQVGGVHDKVYQ